MGGCPSNTKPINLHPLLKESSIRDIADLAANTGGIKVYRLITNAAVFGVAGADTYIIYDTCSWVVNVPNICGDYATLSYIVLCVCDQQTCL